VSVVYHEEGSQAQTRL